MHRAAQCRCVPSTPTFCLMSDARGRPESEFAAYVKAAEERLARCTGPVAESLQSAYGQVQRRFELDLGQGRDLAVCRAAALMLVEAVLRTASAQGASREAVDPASSLVDMNAAHVRSAVARDLPALLQCDALAGSDPRRKSLIQRAVQAKLCFVAEVDSQVVGFAVLHHEFFEQAFIALVIVRSEFRRRGIGVQLVRSAERSSGCSKLFSSTNASNLPAQALFRKSGFVRSGVVENLDPADPEYIYFKEVARHEG